ncbi:MAG: fructose-6-phosphate aldolase [Deltaproteobacteria bacterium]|nr:fructose-6-phosphate aldolase [Deltaproteobacteria bacterium]
MQFFIDTANLEEIKSALDMGLVDGVTTNPSLMAKEADDWRDVAQKICALVPGPVSLEVIALDTEGMVREAKDLVQFGPNVVVKVPMTAEGLKAVRILKSMHIDTNVTLVFSAAQALLAAKAGARYVSPFLGRLDDAGHDGLELIRQIMTIFCNYGFATQIIAASVRSPMHVLDAALAGAHVATIPYKILTQLLAHPLTDKGIKAFLRDWERKNPTAR